MVTDTTNWEKLTKHAEALKKAFTPNQIGRAVGSIVVAGIKNRFETGKDIRGRFFAQNSPLTISNKGSSRPLMDTGKWRNSINYQVSGDRVQVGDNFKWAFVHQEGRVIRPLSGQYLKVPINKGRTSRLAKHFLLLKKVYIPARKVYPEGKLTDEDMKNIDLDIDARIKEILNA